MGDGALGPAMIGVLQHGLYGEEEHRRRSVLEVTSYELYNGPNPARGGLQDPLLGSTGHHYRCATCFASKKLCPGHAGHLEVRVPLPQGIAISEIRRWARVVCLACGAPVVELDRYAALPAARRLVEAALAATEGRRCRVCGTVHPKIVKDDEDYVTFWAVPQAARDPRKEGRKLYPHELLAAFERVADSTVEALGRPLDVHPRKLYLRAINVPPVSIRPGVRNIGAGSVVASYHDVTNILQHLVKRNTLLPAALPPQIGEDLERSITTHQQLYFDLVQGSASTSVTQGSGGKRGILVGTKPAPSLLRRLPRKKGRLRTGLLGAQVFYISRSTISGNTLLRLDEVGVPLNTARTLQVEEVVQPYNLEWLMPFFLNGRRQYPGSTRVKKRATGDVHDVEGLRRDFLEVGDTLFRDVVTGDLAFYNRQPTLERSSIGVHRVVVLEDPEVHTLEHNVSTCENYGADFNVGVQQVAA